MYFGATFYWRILEKLFDFLSEMMNVLSSDRGGTETGFVPEATEPVEVRMV